MGFASRSVSIIRYRVRGEIEGSFWDAVDKGVRTGSFQETDALGDIKASGWVSIDDFTDSEFAGASYRRSNYVGMALRVDSVKVPARILEIHVKLESKKLLESTGQKRLSSSQRRELKDRVRESLKQRVLPSIQVFDLIWDTSRKLVYFGSLGIKVRERVEEHFKRSFGLRLIPLIPYIRAEEILKEKSAIATLDELKPSSFVP